MSNPALTIPLPKSWPAKVRSAMLHIVSLARYAAVYTRSWAADCPKARVRLRTERDRHQEDNALLREEMRIKDARMASIPALVFLLDWYNQHRPHDTLGGKTPDEVYFHRFPANRRPRLEPRSVWQRGSRCALPHALVAGKPGAQFDLEVEHIAGHAHLPIVRLRRAA